MQKYMLVTELTELKNRFYTGLHGGVVFSTIASQQEGSDLGWSLFVGSLHVAYVWVLSEYLGFLPPSKTKHVMLIGDFKLTLGVDVSMHGCVSCMSLSGPVMDWRPIPGYPACRPMTAMIGSLHKYNVEYV